MIKTKHIALFLFVVAIVIIFVIIKDFKSSKPGNRKENRYAFSVDEYKKVDNKLIQYKETKQLKINCHKVNGFTWYDNRIFLVADSFLQVFDLKGNESLRKNFSDEPGCIAVNSDKIYLGFGDHISILNSEGDILSQSSIENEKSLFTSIGINNDKIYIADAGMRKVIIFNQESKKTGEFEGQSGAPALHGFIVPSPYFDLAVNNNELWVVNPGMHSLQQYKDDGSLIKFWEKSSLDIDGFSGCCNPAHFTFLRNGNFVTSEKGLVRVKVYDHKGKLLSVVAASEKFKDGGSAPDVAVDNEDNILALDFDKKMIRIFQLK